MTAHHKFAAQLAKHGLELRHKKRDDTYTILSPDGKRPLGAFGKNLDKGHTRKNILAQIKRATGIDIQ